ncbi:MAG: substrate-binding domain-containing protein [Thiohalospira sp.]
MRKQRLRMLLLALALGAPPGASAVSGVVAFAQDDLSNDWRREQVAAVARVLEDHPDVTFRVTDARGDAAVQALHIDRQIREGVDVLITSPADAELLDPVLRRAREAGIPVILLSRRTRSDAFTSFVHADDRAIARRLASFLFDRLDGEGRILMLRGVPGATPTRHRTETFRELAAAEPGIEVTGRTANYLRGDAILAVDELLRRHDGFPFEAVYAQSDSMAEGARIALRRNGVDPAGLVIAGVDYIDEARSAIRAGEQVVSFIYPTGGKRGGELALRLLDGESVPRQVLLDSRRVTRENVDEMEPIFGTSDSEARP